MAQETSTYQLRNRYNPVYKYFTTIEADNCFIVSTTKIYHNSVFNHWEFVIKDQDFNQYTWKDFYCAEAASKVDVIKAIRDHIIDDMIKITEDGSNSDDYKLTRTAVADRGKDEWIGQ